MDEIDELLISHDELHIVCKRMMEVILDNELDTQLEEKLMEAKVTPGFAQRAQEVEEKFTRHRRILMSTGRIQ